MVKFMAFIKENGEVTSVKWCTPEGLIAEGSYLPDFFAAESKNAILEMLHNAHSKGSDCSVVTQALINNTIIPVTLFCLKLNGEVIVLGFDSGGTEYEFNQEYIRIFNDFVNDIRQEFSKSIKDRELSIREQFEEIQKLNNDLLNTRRELEKANSILERNYQELQSKFVKDPLTGVVGRHQYWTEIEKAIQKNPDKLGILSFIDIDDFKFINDTYGHTVGDLYLVKFAERLQNMNLPNTMVIRISGDEFALFTYGVAQVDSGYTNWLWSKLKEYVFSEPVNISDFSLPISISVGMAVYGSDTEQVNELLEYADFAMYKAKSKGKNRYYRFDKDEYLKQKEPDQRSRALQQVIENEDFYHVYQPVVRVTDGSVYGYAIHLRTDNPIFRNTEDLLQVAMESGVYKALNDASLNMLKRNLQGDLGKTLEKRKLFVTQGPYPLYRYELFQNVTEAANYNQLVLEIVLSAKTPLPDLKKRQAEAKRSGYMLAVNNFGSGETDEAAVLTVSPEFVNLEMELVNTVDDDPDLQEKLRTIIKFAHQQNVQVVAKGVENKATMETLIDLGVDYLQGYYLSDSLKTPGTINGQVRKEIIGVLNNEDK